MPFIFRGHDVTTLLDTPLTAANSLFGILEQEEPTLVAGLSDLWKAHVRGTPMVAGTAWRACCTGRTPPRRPRR
ncbi:MAG: hypothetical protein EOO71_08500 [Myxococcaceae bacterium]|nr:MAG: hypothetical protein EOO71_08500 [Myxococcaceae bacterium]